MKRWLPIIVLGVSACGQTAPPPSVEPPELDVAVVPEPRPKAADELKRPIAALAPETRPEPSAPTAKALASKPAPLPDAREHKPKGRDSSIERGELPAGIPSATIPSLPPPTRKPALPSPPAEGVSHRIGDGAELDWRGFRQPVAPPVKAPPRPEPSAADVPRLGFPQPDRIPTDDPTAELSTARIVNTLLMAPTITAPFVRLLLPDPFEFAGQLKPSPAPEFATTPVLVSPARP
jgi:hypothetical protein